VLLGPPSLEFAPYAKVPGGRARKDARQGTIDQDPEFIAFLESLTHPVTKPSVEPTTDGEEKKEGKPTTPLVQYIREKKANKAKESAAAKAAKAKADKDSKADKAQAKKLLQRADKDGAQQPTEKGEKKAKADKASKEAVKAANKQAANAAKQAAKGGAKDTPSAPAADRKKERGNAAAAAKILQRDLGLGATGGRRKAGKASSGTESPKEEPAAEAEQKEPSPKPGRGRGKGSTTPQTSEALSRAPSDGGTPPASTPPAQGKPSKPAKAKQPGVTPTATQAFLKHANPSQGVTETLLETAFAPFGTVVKVEIDRKKGFGYVDFAEPDGLQKAIAGSPVTVAESQVVVLERKVNAADKSRRGKPGESRGRGRQRKEKTEK
jgi:regulator of nonsense transcripts 3